MKPPAVALPPLRRPAGVAEDMGVAPPEPARAEVELMCVGLPPQLRGVDEVALYLKWPYEFVRQWMEAEERPVRADAVPRMPFLMAGSTKIFSTARLQAWHLRWFPGKAGAEARGGARRKKQGGRGERREEAAA